MRRNDRPVGMGGEDEFLVGEVVVNDSGYLSTEFLAWQGVVREPERNRQDFDSKDPDLIIWIAFDSSR